jgi:hypothetical protein
MTLDNHLNGGWRGCSKRQEIGVSDQEHPAVVDKRAELCYNR